MTPFSKGPWRQVYRDGNHHIEDSDGNSLICDEQYYPWVPKKQGDWNLITAAPELLGALSNLLSAIEDSEGNDDDVEALSSAIDAGIEAVGKAEGK
jgi:hypothetical protein